MHGRHKILILKINISNDCMINHPHRMMTSNCIFCRLLPSWYWYLTFHKIKILRLEALEFEILFTLSCRNFEIIYNLTYFFLLLSWSLSIYNVVYGHDPRKYRNIRNTCKIWVYIYISKDQNIIKTFVFVFHCVM